MFRAVAGKVVYAPLDSSFYEGLWGFASRRLEMIVILKAVLLELHPLMARSNHALIAQVELGFDWPLS